MGRLPSVSEGDGAMGWFALLLAVAAAGCVAVPAAGMYLAMGLGIFAVAAGVVGYRRRAAPGTARLAGSAGIALGTVAFALGATKYGLTLAAVSHLGSLFSP